MAHDHDQSQNSREYKAVFDCYPKIVGCVQQAPSDVAVQLRPSGILAQSDLEFLNNPQHDNDSKAIRIVEVVLNQVKTDSKVLSTFVSALEAAGPWTNTIVSELTSHLIQDTNTADNTEAYKNHYVVAEQLEILLLGFSTICHGIDLTEHYKYLSSQPQSIGYEKMCSDLKISKTGHTPEEIKAIIEGKVEEQQREGEYTRTLIDRCDMEKDIKRLSSYMYRNRIAPTISFARYWDLDLEDFDNELDTLKNALSEIFSDTLVITLLGHGLPESLASKLRVNPISVGEYKNDLLPVSMEYSRVLGKAYTPHKVTSEASKGDLFLFKHGILSPKWVFEQLTKREAIGRYTTVILILDFCYSSAWIDYFSKEIHPCKFKFTKLIVQASCGMEQVSYGQLFIPLWVKLQEPKVDLNKASLASGSVIQKQDPAFWDSDTGPELTTRHIVPGCVEVNTIGRIFRFFEQKSNFFHKFAECNVLDFQPPNGQSRSDILSTFINNPPYKIPSELYYKKP